MQAVFDRRRGADPTADLSWQYRQRVRNLKGCVPLAVFFGRRSCVQSTGERILKRPFASGAVIAAITAAFIPGVFIPTANAGDSQSVSDAIEGSTPIVDMRLRYEEVEQVPLTSDAVALTLRARVGFETGKLWSTSLLAEGNFLAPLIDDYRADNAVATRTQYPLVADPRDHVVNRLQLTNTSLPDTALTIGRQRILLDDQRFVGNVGWRQDEQTFDAVRIVNNSVTGLTFDLTYSDRVHRVYGQDSPQGAYHGDMYLGNVGYQTPFGKLTGFTYLLSFDPITTFPGLTAVAAAPLNPARASTSTYGGRFAGDRTLGVVKLGYLLSYATQEQRGDNPFHFRNEYFLGELSAGVGPLALTAGDEVMQGNGTLGFATPLATTHAFDGWADKFLTTPANGLDNRYGSLAYLWKNVGPLQSITAKAIYRAFAAQHVDVNYGSEWDWQLSAKWQRLTASIFYADYSAAASTPEAIARDTRKFFAQLEFAW